MVAMRAATMFFVITLHSMNRAVSLVRCFGLMEPVTQWIFEPFPNHKDEKLNAMAAGCSIYQILHTQGGTVLGTRDDQGLARVGYCCSRIRY
jgi:hypothetical protein